MLTAIPKNLAMKKQGNALCFMRRWQGFEALLFGVGALLFGSLSLLMYQGLIEIQNIKVGGVKWYLLMAILGVFVYLAFSFTFNKTVIWVTPTAIEVSHHPFPVPWAKKQRLEICDVEDFEIKKVVARNTNSASEYYQLLVRLNDGNTAILLTLLSDENQASFIVHSIKDYLKR